MQQSYVFVVAVRQLVVYVRERNAHRRTCRAVRIAVTSFQPHISVYTRIHYSANIHRIARQFFPLISSLMLSKLAAHHSWGFVEALQRLVGMLGLFVRSKRICLSFSSPLISAFRHSSFWTERWTVGQGRLRCFSLWLGVPQSVLR